MHPIEVMAWATMLSRGRLRHCRRAGGRHGATLSTAFRLLAVLLAIGLVAGLEAGTRNGDTAIVAVTSISTR